MNAQLKPRRLTQEDVEHTMRLAERRLQQNKVTYVRVNASYICIPIVSKARDTRPLVWIDFYPITRVWKKMHRDQKDPIYTGRGIVDLITFLGAKR